MRQAGIIFAFCLFTAFYVQGQVTNLSSFYGNDPKTSLGIATSLAETVILLEKASEIMAEEKDYSFSVSTSGFSSSDTILELVRIDYERYHPDQARYVVNLSSGLSISTYRQLIGETRTAVVRGHYIYDGVYGSLLSSLNFDFQMYIIRNESPEGQEQQYLDFFKETILLMIENGDVSNFHFYARHINDAMRQAGLEQLKDPKWPPQYVDQYMEDRRDLWDSARIDTIGIPEQYFADRYVLYNRCPHPSVDSLCREYAARIRLFNRYDKIAKEQGITPQEAQYNDIKSSFFRKGYKEIYYMINYALKHNDEVLLPALREFVKAHPDYELNDIQRELYGEVHEFIMSNR